MAVKKSPASGAPTRRNLIEIGHQHLGLDESRVQHWIREFLKLGVKPDELRRSITSLDVINQMRDSDLEQQRDLAQELTANCDAIVVLGHPRQLRSARALSSFHRPASFSPSTQLFFESAYPNTAWLNSLLQHLLSEGLRLGAIILHPDSALAPTLENIEEIISLRHGADESERRIVIVHENNAPLAGGLERYRRLPVSERLTHSHGIFSAAGTVPLTLLGLDPFQFAEGARSQCRSLEKAYNAEDSCLLFTALRVHLLHERRLREVHCATDPGMLPWLEWCDHLSEPSARALTQAAPVPGRLCGAGEWERDQLAVALGWDEDDSPGELLSPEPWIGPVPRIHLNLRKRDVFSLGAASAFLSCSTSIAHRALNLPTVK